MTPAAASALRRYRARLAAPAPEPEPETPAESITLAEASRVLGVHKFTLLRWRRAGRLPVVGTRRVQGREAPLVDPELVRQLADESTNERQRRGWETRRANTAAKAA
jgi:hypothetical protein